MKTRGRGEGFTLLEVIVVVIILAVAASGLSLSIGALTRTNLRSSAARVASAVRYAYNRALINGTTVRIAFDLPGSSFSIEEAHGRVTLARADDERRLESADGEGGEEMVAADPWVAAQARIQEAIKPSLGASPFGALKSSSGSVLKRYQKIELGRRVQLVKLLVPHEPAPKDAGRGAIHFVPGGHSEHAVVHLSDGSGGIFSVEVHPLTGKCRVYSEAHEPEHLMGGPEDSEDSEVRL
jgi:general secretion pathway protein H